MRAIRNGEVDAVMVTGQRGEQVYTLSGADRVYRQLIETMSEGAAILSADAVILFALGRDLAAAVRSFPQLSFNLAALIGKYVS